MARRVFGVEIEYPLVAFNRMGLRVDPESAITRFFDLVRQSLPHLPDAESMGMFLANGARLYPDCGKVEWAGPEVTTPEELCRFVLAGEQTLAGIARRMSGDGRISQAFLGRHNVSYGESPNTWACHASIGCQLPPDKLPVLLIPHLVSRVVYSGAGGFDSFAPGIRFLLSPRVAHLVTDISSNSTHDRGIFHTKNEPLCDGQHRLHIMVGECLCSQTSLWLTHAATVLVVAACEAGVRPRDRILLNDPLAAMRTFVADPTCTARVADQTGRLWTAREIQQHYLELVEQRLGHDAFPAWAASACVLWRNMIERLQAGAEGVAGTLDWAIKLWLFRRLAERRGVPWESLGPWNQVCDQLQAAQRALDPGSTSGSLTRDGISRSSPIGGTVDDLTPFLERHNLRWEQFPEILDLREQLFELDGRYGELSERGLFAALDAAGTLRHRVEGVDRIEEAIKSPPTTTRAGLRGRMVQELHAQGHYVCSWSAVFDTERHRFLDLSDPFTEEQAWIERSSELHFATFWHRFLHRNRATR